MGCYIMAMSHGTHNAKVLGSKTALPEYVSLYNWFAFVTAKIYRKSYFEKLVLGVWSQW